MQEIPLRVHPNQKLKVLLNGQECALHLYQKGKRMYVDLTVNDVPVVGGAVCQNKANIVQRAQDAFVGKLFFVDVLSDTPPQWEGLGTRYKLIFATENENVQL